MIRGYAVQEPFGWSVALTVVDHPEPGDFNNRPRILRLGSQDGGAPAAVGWEEADPNAAHEPTMRLGIELAFALADALGELRHGTGEVRALRKDYDAERARTDKLLDVVAEIARTRA